MNEPVQKLSRAEFNQLTLEQRLAYIQALMADLQEKVRQTRQQAQRTRNALRASRG